MGFDGFVSEAEGQPRTIVVAVDAAAAAPAAEAARHAGVAVVATLGFAGLADGLADIAHADLLLVEAEGVDGAALDAALPLLAARATADRARLVVAFVAEQLDAVTLHLLGTPAELLCDARIDERVAAIALGGVIGDRFHASERDAERLRRLNAEVARIAEVLARLARDETAPGDSARDRTNEFVPPPGAVEPVLSAAKVRDVIRARRLRGRFFDPALFADPAWDMLLDLFAAHLEDRRVSVSSLCIASAVPPTTALRWITTLVDAGLFERRDDPTDRRRAFLTLTARGANGMTGYARAVAQAGLGWA
ncbi:winged helix DNA-binding protein [Sphingomonas silueang]|uniref:winged helix DNA-binding protein n=1 Tax=Sphingomonas silueang TaxID=3156617 RepID=UPI0032B3F314